MCFSPKKPLSAQSQQFNAIDTGVLSDIQAHQSNFSGYSAGLIPYVPGIDEEFRNFAVFDLSSFAGGATQAYLEYWQPANGYVSPDAFEQFVLRDVSTPASQFLTGNLGPGVFNDVGTGTVYGSTNIDASSNESFVRVDLNLDGLMALDAAAAGLFVIGGAVDTLDEATELIFGNTGSLDGPPGDIRLVITTVPEPGSGVVLLVSAILLARRRRA